MSFINKVGLLARNTANVTKTHTRTMATLKPYNRSHDLKGFTTAGMKKHPAVIPLVVIIAGALVGLCGFITYSSMTRTDVNFRRKNRSMEPDEFIDINEAQKAKKLLVFNQEYTPIPELQEALKFKEEAKH